MRDGESVGKLDSRRLKVSYKTLQIGLIFVEGASFSVIYRFGEHELDTEGFRLTARGEEVAVEPQVFSLVQFLIENRERVVSKDEIIEQVWHGRIVSDGTLNSRINSARRALGDDGKAQAVIKTFPRRGFKFVSDIAMGEPEEDLVALPQSISDKTSIAVLPFESLSTDREQEFFADAIADDIITGLSRLRWLFVMSRNSSFSYKGQSSDVRQVAQDLGVRYVLSGSVAKMGNRVRISCQLLDGQTGAHIWAERYDRELENLFNVQDEITRMVVGAVEPEVAGAETNRVKATHVENLDAWTAYHQGMGLLWDRGNRGNVEQLATAMARLRTAIELDPDFAHAHAGLASCYAVSLLIGLSKDRQNDLSAGLAAATRAVSADVEDSFAHSVLGTFRFLAKDTNLAIPTLEMALELNPSQTNAYITLAMALVSAGRSEEAIQRMATALQISKYDPQRGPLMVRMAEAYFQIGAYEQCVEWARKSLLQPETQIWGNCMLVAGLSHLDRPDDAQQAAQVLLAKKPDFTCEFARTNLPIWEEKFQARCIDGLRMAGIPVN